MKLKAGYSISFLLRVPEPLKKALGTDSYDPVILILGQKGEMESSQPLWKIGVGINALGRKTAHCIAKEQFLLITREKDIFFFFLLFTFNKFYLSVLKFTSILSSPLWLSIFSVLCFFFFWLFDFSVFYFPFGSFFNFYLPYLPENKT